MGFVASAAHTHGCISEVTVGWVGRGDESGDERAVPPELLPTPAIQPQVSGELAYTVEFNWNFGCCQKIVSDTVQGVTCTIHLTYFLTALRNIC